MLVQQNMSVSVEHGVSAVLRIANHVIGAIALLSSLEDTLSTQIERCFNKTILRYSSRGCAFSLKPQS